MSGALINSILGHINIKIRLKIIIAMLCLILAFWFTSVILSEKQIESLLSLVYNWKFLGSIVAILLLSLIIPINQEGQPIDKGAKINTQAKRTINVYVISFIAVIFGILIGFLGAKFGINLLQNSLKVPLSNTNPYANLAYPPNNSIISRYDNYITLIGTTKNIQNISPDSQIWIVFEYNKQFFPRDFTPSDIIKGATFVPMIKPNTSFDGKVKNISAWLKPYPENIKISIFAVGPSGNEEIWMWLKKYYGNDQISGISKISQSIKLDSINIKFKDLP